MTHSSRSGDEPDFTTSSTVSDTAVCDGLDERLPRARSSSLSHGPLGAWSNLIAFTAPAAEKRPSTRRPGRHCLAVRALIGSVRPGVTGVHDIDRRAWQADQVSEERTGHAGRSEWVQADLRCLMCGRVAGQLVGRRPPASTASVASGKPLRFAAFRLAESAAPAVRLTGGEQFSCTTCGGSLISDQVEAFSTYVEVSEEVEERKHRGRPAKPWRRTVVSPAWMLELAIAG
jgi:hypothetical protein